ncbi:penicillin-binding transpeptidase domain-containing protein [Lentibacillus sp. Marseille-P4043]|uniref:penicillin-binding transpeptidase domain-containing protein n=1 Tax=Lentibacillus sp. Marseille-P4043 TaxID=2040293 RepID=UPI000D0B5734|nr:penicillin-binding transpeptidase domain-containing protein [Lentibacillus sp. Marseille-P4043]
MKRIWIGIIMAIFLAVMAGCSDKIKPEDTFKAYLSSWEDMDFEKMFQHLSQQSKKEITKKEFVERYKDIYKGIEIKNLQVDGIFNNKDEENLKDDSVAFKYHVKMETMAGPIEFTHQATLVKEKNESNKEWFVEWEPALIFPSLEKGETIGAETLEASRGEISDRNGSGLAINAKANVIGVVPGKFDNETEESKEKLSDLLGITIDEINKKLNASWVNPDSFVPLATLPLGEKNLKPFFEIPGVAAQEKIVRTYPFGVSAAHLTGYVREITAEQLVELEEKGYSSGDIVGKTGLEKIFEKRLRGENGGHIYIKKTNGSFKETLAKTEPIPGEDVQLTIDANLQQEIYDQLKGDAGTAAAVDPKTGAVLSLVSSPSYDPNAFIRGLSDEQWKEWSDNPEEPFLNRFINRYAPGSVFKTITAVVGLKSGVTDPGETRHIEGLRWSKDKSWGDYYVTRVHDKTSVNLRDAFVYSDNIYFAQEALEMGKDTFLTEAKAFGFEEELPIPFSIEPSILSNNGIGSEAQLADSAYGQGEVMMSALHLALAYTPFVNEGDLLSPYLLKEEGERTVWKENLMESKNSELIQEDLIQVVEDPNGTAHSAYISGMTIAGKSGTAEIKKDKDDKNGTENGWFVGFDTEDNELLLAMMIEDVKQRGGSGYVVPKARNVFASLQ